MPDLQRAGDLTARAGQDLHPVQGAEGGTEAMSSEATAALREALRKLRDAAISVVDHEINRKTYGELSSRIATLRAVVDAPNVRGPATEAVREPAVTGSGHHSGGGRGMKYDDFDLADGEWQYDAGEKAPARTVRIWTDATGQYADINGIVRSVDTVIAAMLDNQREGVMEVWPQDGQFLVWLNAAGRARVETALRRGGFDAGMDA